MKHKMCKIGARVCFLILIKFSCVAGVTTFARVLSQRVLPGGDVEITVPFEDTVLKNGQRFANVRTYPCVRTVPYGAGVRQIRTQCRPRVIIANATTSSQTSGGGSGSGAVTNGGASTTGAATATPVPAATTQKPAAPVVTEILTPPPTDAFVSVTPPNSKVETPPTTKPKEETPPPIDDGADSGAPTTEDPDYEGE